MNTKVVVSQFGGPEVLALQTAEMPQPEVDELVIRVAYSGVGAIDAIMRAGGLKELNLQPPFTPGIEVSGTVQAVGKDVTGFEAGQLVAAMMLPDGGYAEYVRAKAGLAVVLPAAEWLAAAASMVNLVTAYLLITEIAPVRAGDTVAVHGATGGLGTACIQILRHFQPRARLTATVRSTRKLAYVQGLGCETILTTGTFGQAARTEQLYSHIIDPIGGELRRTSLSALSPYGTLLAVGNVSDDYESSISSQQLWLEGKAVAGFNLALFASLQNQKVQAAMRAIVEALAGGNLAPTPSQMFKLSDVQAAHRYLQEQDSTGRVVLAVAKTDAASPAA